MMRRDPEEFEMDGVRLVRYRGKGGRVVIPRGIAEIGYGAFFGTEIVEAVIPASVETVEGGAFGECARLERIIVENIENEEFSHSESVEATCREREDVGLSEGIGGEHSARSEVGEPYCESQGESDREDVSDAKDKGRYKAEGNCLVERETGRVIAGCNGGEIPSFAVCIWEDAFSKRNMTKIIVPDGVTVIAERAFFGCDKLKSVALPQGLESIGERAFFGTGIEEIDIPKDVLAIGAAAFGGTDIARAIVPAGATYIGENPFEGCARLKSIESDGIGVRYRAEENCIVDVDEDEIVAGCAGSKIPNGTKSIGEKAFKGSGIREIKIPYSVTWIGRGAFEDCDMLSLVELPARFKGQDIGIPNGTRVVYR